MTRRKKNLPPEKEPIAPGVYQVAVGKGMTKRREIRFERNIKSEEVRNYLLRHPLDNKYGFDGYIADYEREAKKILEDAGLPTETDRFYTMPGGELLPIPTIQEGATDIYTGAGGLLELVTSRDYREREAPEWYAAAILDSVLNVRLAIRRGDADITAGCAVELGKLITEAKGLGYFREEGIKGGKQKRRKLPIKELIHRLTRKNGNSTATELWEMIPSDPVDGIRVKGHKFYRKGGRLHAIRKVDGIEDWRPAGKPLIFDSFRKRVSKARKPPAR